MQSMNIFGHSEALMQMQARMRGFVDREAIPREHADLAHDIEKLDQVARLLARKPRKPGSMRRNCRQHTADSVCPGASVRSFSKKPAAAFSDRLPSIARLPISPT